MSDEINATKEYAFTEYRPEEVSAEFMVSPEAWEALWKITPLTRWEQFRWTVGGWMHLHRPHLHFGPCQE